MQHNNPKQFNTINKY